VGKLLLTRALPFNGTEVLVITYEYRIEEQEVEMTVGRCPRVKLDLPERVGVSSPPLIVKMESVH
jgi:hypothetical protein